MTTDSAPTPASAPAPEARLAEIRALFSRTWDCRVVSSGFHNGTGCTPWEPHDPKAWGCAYRWIAHRLSDSEARRLGIAPPEPEPEPEGDSTS